MYNYVVNGNLMVNLDYSNIRGNSNYRSMVNVLIVQDFTDDYVYPTIVDDFTNVMVKQIHDVIGDLFNSNVLVYIDDLGYFIVVNLDQGDLEKRVV